MTSEIHSPESGPLPVAQGTTTRRVAIVTGSSRGIGAAIAKRLAADGLTVVVNYAGRAADAEQVVEEIRSSGGQVMAVRADVSDPLEVNALFDQTETAFGGIDVLINNAGIMQPGLVSLADTSDELFDRLFAVNVKGTFNALRLAATRLRAGGRIVNFSSSLTTLAMPGYAIYSGTKSAVETFTKVFAKELRGRNITVNAVAPGPTGTDLFFYGKTQEQIEMSARSAPLERLGEPADIAAVVSFLVGADGGWVNGQTIRVNGGAA